MATTPHPTSRSQHNHPPPVEEAARDLEVALEVIEQQAKDNATFFEKEKMEVIHFGPSRARIASNPPVRGITPIGRAVRWLGVWLDLTLSFILYAKAWASKAAVVVIHMKRLSSTLKGSLPDQLAEVARSYVGSRVTYGAKAWWVGPGARRRLKTAAAVLDGPLKSVARLVVPAILYTPLAAVRREAGLPTVEVTLNKVRLSFAARLAGLDDYYPLV